MDDGLISMLVLLDCSKCFDVIPHDKLLDKLEMYGVDNRWFKDYLQGHQQQVKITKNGVKSISKTLPNTTGVYQGGSLSCLLFSIFANDLILYTDKTKIVQFADDTQILISGPKHTILDMIRDLETELSHLFDWFSQNTLKLNASKTQLIVFGTSAMLRDLPSVSIRVGNTVITESREVKNLGIHMDRHLTYRPHVDHLVAKCTGMLMGLLHVRHVIPHSVLTQVINALVISSIRYCVSVYGTCGVTELHRVQKVINFSARVITGKRKFQHISHEVSRLGLPTVSKLVSYHQLCLVHNVLATSEPLELRRMFVRADHTHGTRNADQLRPPRARTNAGKRRLANIGAVGYNALPSELHNTVSRAAFKRALTQHLQCDQ